MALNDLLKRAHDVKQYMQSDGYKEDAEVEKERRRAQELRDRELSKEKEMRKINAVKMKFAETLAENRLKMYDILEGLIMTEEMRRPYRDEEWMPGRYHDMESQIHEINSRIYSELGNTFFTISKDGNPALSYIPDSNDKGAFKENYFDIYLDENKRLITPELECVDNAFNANAELNHLTIMCGKLDKIAEIIENDLSYVMEEYEYDNRVTDENLEKFTQANTEKMFKENKNARSALDKLMEKAGCFTGNKKEKANTGKEDKDNNQR